MQKKIRKIKQRDRDVEERIDCLSYLNKDRENNIKLNEKVTYRRQRQKKRILNKRDIKGEGHKGRETERQRQR